MTRPKNVWLLGWLSASCVVNGFTIEEQRTGGGGAGVGGNTGGSPSTNAGAANQGGASGAVPQGGKAGMAGSQSDAGSPGADAGESSVGQGGEGGAPSGSTAACDQSKGMPPLFCDDFESGSFNNQKWTPPAGLAVTSSTGPGGESTKLVYLDGPALETTQLGSLPITAAGAEVTVSFWLKVVAASGGSPIVAFPDRSAAQSTIRLNVIMNELGWRSSGSNFMVPQMPTTAMFSLDVWTCVSIHLSYSSMVLSYQSQGAAAVSTLTVDDTATPNVDANWHTLAPDNRVAGGYPTFSGVLAGTMNQMYLDDVRIAADTSSVCPF